MIKTQSLISPLRQLTDLITRLTTSYGEPDLAVIRSLQADMKIPLNPDGSIHDDLMKMTATRDQLPIGRQAERQQVDAVLNNNYPNQMLRTWSEYTLVCAQQVEIYRLAYLFEAVATFAKTFDDKPRGDFCFECNKHHDLKKCSVVAAIISVHPEYNKVLQAKRTDPMRIQQDDHTLLVAPEFALVFNSAFEKARPQSEHCPSRPKSRSW